MGTKSGPVLGARFRTSKRDLGEVTFGMNLTQVLMSAGRVAGGWRSHPGPRKTAPRVHFWCRNLAPKLGPLFGPRVNKIQAHAVWQWYIFCAARVPSGKAPLRIHVDETSVCLFQGGGKGTIVFNKRKDPPAMEPHESASRAK